MTDLDAIFLAVLHGKLIKISLHNTELSEALFVFDSFFERTFALLGGSSKTWKAIEISAGPFSTNKPNLSFWRNPPRNWQCSRNCSATVGKKNSFSITRGRWPWTNQPTITATSKSRIYSSAKLTKNHSHSRDTKTAPCLMLCFARTKNLQSINTLMSNLKRNCEMHDRHKSFRRRQTDNNTCGYRTGFFMRLSEYTVLTHQQKQPQKFSFYHSHLLHLLQNHFL